MVERVSAAQGCQEVDHDLKERILAKEDEVTILFDAHCALTEVPGSEKKMMEWLKSTAAGQSRGSTEECVAMFIGIVVDPGVIGEPVTAPHLRTLPINVHMLKASPYFAFFNSGILVSLEWVPSWSGWADGRGMSSW